LEQVKLSTDVVVIGSGVSGMTAALYLKRSNLNVVVIESNAPGGQINLTAKIENYPGFPSVTGPELAMAMFGQIKDMEVEYKFGEVREVEDKGSYKVVKLGNEEITCRAIVAASGRKARHLGVVGEKELMGKGISLCAICDGPFFKGKEVAVIGGGNSALDEALYLSDIVSKIYLIHRKDTFRADGVYIDKVTKNEKIEILYNSEVESFNDENGMLNSVTVINNKSNEKKKIEVSGAFTFIGFVPNAGYLSKLGVLTSNGSVEVDCAMRTKVKGIYACGDVVKKELYQIVTAAGEGAEAAVSCAKDLGI